MALTAQLVYLFNLSLETEVFPDDWKVATIVPLHKGGPSDTPGNFRPVSLLPLPGKILEKVVHANISNYLERNNYLVECQGGFRKNRSTTSTIVSFTDRVLRAMDQAKVTLATFIDLKKAFDTINHAVLLRKLEHLGIKGLIQGWCRNYLTNRKQSTIANGIVSEPRRVVCGVPQGSVLGPLFFLIYVNDLLPHLRGIEVNLYADDTVLYVSGREVATCRGVLQNALNLFEGWCDRNALHINVAKTKSMLFGTARRIKNAGEIVMKLKGLALQQVPSYRYLGVTLDATLSFKQHLAGVTRTVSHKVYVLSRVRKFLTTRTAMMVYKSMIMPYFDYADIVYEKAPGVDLEKIQRLQNRALKVCLKVGKFEETEVIHRRAKIPLLSNRRKEHLLNYMYKQKELGLNLSVNRVNTRSAGAPKFVLPSPNLQCYKGSIEYSGAKAWNSLPIGYRQVPTYKSFKAKIHKELMDTVN